MSALASEKGNTWKSYQQWYPIPQSELQKASQLILKRGVLMELVKGNLTKSNSIKHEKVKQFIASGRVMPNQLCSEPCSRD